FVGDELGGQSIVHDVGFTGLLPYALQSRIDSLYIAGIQRPGILLEQRQVVRQRVQRIDGSPFGTGSERGISPVQSIRVRYFIGRRLRVLLLVLLDVFLRRRARP